MRKQISILLFSCLCVFAGAQSPQVYDFRPLPSDRTALREQTSRLDMGGNECALLKLETPEGGWTFDAGADVIEEVRKVDGGVWIYLPAGSTVLNAAHKEWGVLRWRFPESLQAGATYSAKLRHASAARQGRMPREEPAVTPRAKPFEGKRLSTHFVDAFVGLHDGNIASYGLSYTYMTPWVGPYASLSYDYESRVSVFAGASVRPLGPDAALDWQVYGGAGLAACTRLTPEVGMRIGFRSAGSVSCWDFGFGCQFTSEGVMPTISVGLCLWGIPVVVCLGVFCM